MKKKKFFYVVFAVLFFCLSFKVTEYIIRKDYKAVELHLIDEKRVIEMLHYMEENETLKLPAAITLREIKQKYVAEMEIDVTALNERKKSTGEIEITNPKAINYDISQTSIEELKKAKKEAPIDIVMYVTCDTGTISIETWDKYREKNEK